MKKFVSLLIFMLFSNLALAANYHNYVAIDYTWGILDDKVGNELELDGARIRYGNYIVSNLALELQFLYGASGDSITSGTSKLKVDLRHTASIFLRGEIGSTFKLYVLAGYSETTFETSGSVAGYTLPAKKPEEDLSYGGGIQFMFDRDTSLDINYIVYHDEEYFEYAGASLGFSHHF